MIFFHRNGAPVGRRTTVVGIALGLGLAVGMCLVRAGAADVAALVKIDNFSFEPADRTVEVGSAVRWENDDDIPHLVVFTDGSFRSKALDTNDSATFTFGKPGGMTYFCGLHPQMKGKITVVP